MVSASSGRSPAAPASALGRIRARLASRDVDHVPLPLGPAAGPGRPAGYHIDLRAKVRRPGWRPPASPDRTMWVTEVTQAGLARYEHFVADRDAAWLRDAMTVADHLVATQRHDPPFAGAWPYGYAYPHTFRLRPPWVMGMAQGQAASLLVRMALETGRDRYAQAARAALRPLAIPVGQPGGVRSRLPTGGALLEEYPTDPPSHVLNGAIFALLGLHDVWAGLGDEEAGREFAARMDDLAGGIGLWDLGYWSRYDLFPHPLVNVASPFYHELHITLLLALDRLRPDVRLTAARRRFEAYRGRPVARARAVAAKVAFRLAVPRDPRLARLVARARGRRPEGA